MFSETCVWIFLSIVMLAIYTRWRVKKTFHKYLELESSSQVNAKQMANHYLCKIKANEVKIKETNRKLDDRYNPANNSLYISYPNSRSLAALGITAHELGHLTQYVKKNRLLNLFSLIVSASSFLSQIAFPIFLSGFILHYVWLTRSGLIVYCLALIFTFFTLPLEIDASKKALMILEKEGFINHEDEIKKARKVLLAAGLTYIVSPALAFLHPFKKLLDYQR